MHCFARSPVSRSRLRDATPQTPARRAVHAGVAVGRLAVRAADGTVAAAFAGAGAAGDRVRAEPRAGRGRCQSADARGRLVRAERASADRGRWLRRRLGRAVAVGAASVARRARATWRRTRRGCTCTSRSTTPRARAWTRRTAKPRTPITSNWSLRAARNGGIFLIASAAPGSFQARPLDDRVPGLPDLLTGQWQEDAGAYRIELRLPRAQAPDHLGIAVFDADAPTHFDSRPGGHAAVVCVVAGAVQRSDAAGARPACACAC